jgi:hypothetical protein
MKDEKKIDFVFDVNKQLQQQIKESKLIKYALAASIVIGGVLALGVAMKVLSYAIGNYNVLKKNIYDH